MGGICWGMWVMVMVIAVCHGRRIYRPTRIHAPDKGVGGVSNLGFWPLRVLPLRASQGTLDKTPSDITPRTMGRVSRSE